MRRKKATSIFHSLVDARYFFLSHLFVFLNGGQSSRKGGIRRFFIVLRLLDWSDGMFEPNVPPTLLYIEVQTTVLGLLPFALHLVGRGKKRVKIRLWWLRREEEKKKY